MASQARKPQFGVSVVPLAEPPEFALRATRAAEEARLDLVGIQDPPYQRRFLDAWTLVATLRSPLPLLSSSFAVDSASFGEQERTLKNLDKQIANVT